MDQQIKLILGEYAFTIAALQHQIEELNKKIEDGNKRSAEHTKHSK